MLCHIILRFILVACAGAFLLPASPIVIAQEKPEGGAGNDLSVVAAWTRVITVFAKRDKEVAEQLRAAKQQYPLLTSSYVFLSSYTAFLHSHMELMSWKLQQQGMQLDFPPFPGPPWADLCNLNPLSCKCRGGDIDACIAMTKDPSDIGSVPGFSQEIVGVFQLIPTCKQLKDRYAEALKCDEGYLNREKQLEAKGSSLRVKEMKLWMGCRRAEDSAWTELAARGCMQPVLSIFPIRP